MSDAETTICPECETEQPDTAPFCQNCGYRMRSPKTVREPAVSVSPDPADEEGGDAGPAREPSTGTSAGDATPDRAGRRPNRKMVPGSEDRSDSASGSGPQGSPPDPQPPQSPVDSSSDTLVEGVRAVSSEESDTDAGPGDDPADAADESGAQGAESPPARDQRASGTPMETQRTRIRWIVGGTVAACIAVVTGLTWLHLEREATADVPDTGGVEPEIVDIEEGRFRRGLDEQSESFILEFCYKYHEDPERSCNRDRLLEGEYPQQTVEMPAYGIDSTPVRNADYRECVEQETCDPVAYDECEVWTPRGLQVGVRVPEVLRRGDRPVVCIDRSRAAEYCEFRGGRLPTHNQWERAARGDETPIFPWGNRWQPDRANWGEMDVMQIPVAGQLDGHAWTSPPGAYPDDKSPHGLYDMGGNVSEWIRAGDDSLKGWVRGGSWVSNPFELRTTGRTGREPDTKRTDIGFRCVYPPSED